jgi:hypothetical protein
LAADAPPAVAREVRPDAPAAEPEPPAARAKAIPADPPPLVSPALSALRRPAPVPARADSHAGVLIWAGVAALAAALVAGGIVFREQVVRLWPASSVAYAGLGLHVSGGLALEEVHATPAFVDGRPVLSVTGMIRNLRDQPAQAPPVRVTLLDRAGKPVAAKIARPLEATLPGRSARHFAIAVADPPLNAADLEVRFEAGPGAKPAPRADAAVLAPVEAAPAPAAPLSPAASTEHG